jgi:hypothetical protein
MVDVMDQHADAVYRPCPYRRFTGSDQPTMLVCARPLHDPAEDHELRERRYTAVEVPRIRPRRERLARLGALGLL